MHTLTKTSTPKDQRKFKATYYSLKGTEIVYQVIYQTHYFKPVSIENIRSINSCDQNKHSFEDYINDIQELFELSDIEKSELSNYDIVQLNEDNLELNFEIYADKDVTKVGDLIVPKIEAIRNNQADITYYIQSYIEYDYLHEVFNWEDTRTDEEVIKGIDKDEEVPWSDQDLLEYEAPIICDSFNKEYGTNLEADFLTSNKDTGYGLYEFKVNRKKLLASYGKDSH